MRIIGIAVAVVLGFVLYSAGWNFAFSLLDARDSLLVFLGFGLAGILIGLAVWVGLVVIHRFQTFYKE